MVNKHGRNQPPPENYVKPVPTPPPPPPNREFRCGFFGMKETDESIKATRRWLEDNKHTYEGKGMVTPDVMERLSPTRRQVVITLLSITSPSDDHWVVEVYDAINNAFFEKAARLLLPHSSRLSRKMLIGE